MARKALPAAKRRGGQPTVALVTRREISGRLRDFMGGQGINQGELATRAGIAASTVSGWFGSKPRLPTTAHVMRLAELLNLNPQWLLLNQGASLNGAVAELEPSVSATLDYVEAHFGGGLPDAGREITRRLLGDLRRRPQRVVQMLGEWIVREMESELRQLRDTLTSASRQNVIARLEALRSSNAAPADLEELIAYLRESDKSLANARATLQYLDGRRAAHTKGRPTRSGPRKRKQ